MCHRGLCKDSLQYQTITRTMVSFSLGPAETIRRQSGHRVAGPVARF